MVYLTHRQVDIILDALQTAGHLTTPATEDPEPGGDDQSVCEYGMR
jgi:hypothetical protein